MLVTFLGPRRGLLGSWEVSPHKYISASSVALRFQRASRLEGKSCPLEISHPCCKLTRCISRLRGISFLDVPLCKRPSQWKQGKSLHFSCDLSLKRCQGFCLWWTRWKSIITHMDFPSPSCFMLCLLPVCDPPFLFFYLTMLYQHYRKSAVDKIRQNCIGNNIPASP